MTVTVKGLIIDNDISAHESLEEFLHPEIHFDVLESTNNVYTALQHHINEDFQLCLIEEKFAAKDIASFFKDYKKLSKPTDCLFIQLRENVPFSFDRASLKNWGYDFVSSKAGNQEERELLAQMLLPLVHRREQRETRGHLPDVVDHLLKEVDKIAFEKKRGKDKTLSTIYSEHLKRSTEKFQDLQEDYIENLTNAVNDAKPFEDLGLAIPEGITRKNLPHLTGNSYVGQSRRVFDKLHKMHKAEIKPAKVPQTEE